jgi:hypothetical protein
VQPTTPRRAFLGAVLLLVLLLLVGLVPPAGAERETGPVARKVKTKKVAPGLTYTKIVEKKVPRRTFVLTVDLEKAISLDVTLGKGRLPSNRTLSRIVKRVGALAGVNGDFGSGKPIHPFAQDGQLVNSSEQLGTLFAVTRDESQVIFDRPELEVTVTDRSDNRVYRLDRWNDGDPLPGEFAGFSPLGGTLEAPPANACSARLLPVGPPTPADGSGVDQDFTVDEVQCSQDPLSRDGGVVLSAAPSTDEAILLLALEPGTPMRLHWTFGWADVLDAVGGAPLLLRDGAFVNECNSGCGRVPRTGVGVTARGRILLVVVDGRKPRWSLGPTVGEFARIMRDLGAVTALNLDGGGSSTMVVNGEVVNRPADGRERAISNAIVILPGADPGET